eukprot:sb/3463884/
MMYKRYTSANIIIIIIIERTNLEQLATMAERPKTAGLRRGHRDQVELPDELVLPSVPSDGLFGSEDPSGVGDDLSSLAEDDRAVEEIYTEGTAEVLYVNPSADDQPGLAENLAAKFRSDTDDWEKKHMQNKPLDMLKKFIFKQPIISISVKRPWSAVSKVQPAFELTSRPGTAPSRRPIAEEQETSLNGSQERIASPPGERVPSPAVPEAWAQQEESGQPVEESGQPVEGSAAKNQSSDEIRESPPPPPPASRQAWTNGAAERSPSTNGTAERSPSISGAAERSPSIKSTKSRTSTKSATNGTYEPFAGVSPTAYIPYNVAKKNIARVLGDMKVMREDHCKSIAEIHRIYKEIELNTQSTFTEFVTELRGDYRDKVQEFTRIIDLCIKDGSRKELLWKDQAEGLYANNTKLIREINDLIAYSNRQKVNLNKTTVFLCDVIKRLITLLPHLLQARELASLRHSMTEEKRQLLVTLQARENRLRDNYNTYIEQLNDKRRKKVDLLNQQHLSVSVSRCL